MNHKPNAEETYRHFKGNNYQIITLATDAETMEELVVYQALYGERGIYVRTLKNFTEKLDSIQYPDANQTYRFEKIEASEVETVHPKVLEFLLANTYEEKLRALTELREVITDSMINTLAFSCDLEVIEGPVERRYEELKNCIVTRKQFECNRLR